MCWFFSRKPLLCHSKAASQHDSQHLITPVDTKVSKKEYLKSTGMKHWYAGMNLGVCIAHTLKIHCFLFIGLGVCVLVGLFCSFCFVYLLVCLFCFVILIPQAKSTLQYGAKVNHILGDTSPPDSSLHCGKKYTTIIYVTVTTTFNTFSLFFSCLLPQKERILFISMNSDKKGKEEIVESSC